MDLCFNCVTSEGIKLQFSPTERGLHVLNCAEYFGLDRPNWVFGNKDNAGVIDTCMAGFPELNNSDGIDTIEKSKSRFSARDIRRADRTRRLQYVSGHPSDKTLGYAADTNGLKNNKVTRRDVILARDMLGVSKHAMAGKRTRTRPDAVNAEEQLVTLPPSILNYYKDVELSVDVLHVNRLPFLASVSKNIHYTTIDALDNMKTANDGERYQHESSQYMLTYSSKPLATARRWAAVHRDFELAAYYAKFIPRHTLVHKTNILFS